MSWIARIKISLQMITEYTTISIIGIQKIRNAWLTRISLLSMRPSLFFFKKNKINLIFKINNNENKIVIFYINVEDEFFFPFRLVTVPHKDAFRFYRRVFIPRQPLISIRI